MCKRSMLVLDSELHNCLSLGEDLCVEKLHLASRSYGSSSSFTGGTLTLCRWFGVEVLFSQVWLDTSAVDGL